MPEQFIDHEARSMALEAAALTRELTATYIAAADALREWQRSLDRSLARIETSQREGREELRIIVKNGHEEADERFGKQQEINSAFIVRAVAVENRVAAWRQDQWVLRFSLWFNGIFIATTVLTMLRIAKVV